VTLSLHRAELLRSASDAAARLRTGVDVAVELAVSLEPPEVIGRLVHRAAEAVDAGRVALVLIDGSGAEVVEAFDRDATGPAPPHGARFPVADLVSGDEPVILRAMRDRQPHLTGPYRVPRLQAVSDWGQEGTRHTLTLPLVYGGKVMAVLLVSRLRDQPFRHEDALTLQLVGNVAVLALRNARLFADAQDANRARSDFLNMASHELRTPLTVIKGYLSMLCDGSLDPAPDGLQQPVELLASKAEELGSLIDDLLFTSKLEAGRLPAHPMRLDLRIAVQEAARRAEPRAQLLGGELLLEVTDEALVVRADLEHVARVLDNLVNNALTYRRPGQPAWVRLSARIEDGMAVVGVEDRGRGIPPEMRDRIFERFVRGERAGAGSSGSGLGLYISSQLAARHGGRLQLDHSVPGEGSRFSLRLPTVAPR
jgi:signal transduction histidine kinase